MKYTNDKLLDFITEKFKDKVDKAGYPYVQHLIRVANNAADQFYSSEKESEKLYQIGLLHDILEDTNTTEEELKEFVTDDIIDIVKILTRHSYNKKSIPTQRDTYMDYIERIAQSHYLAIMVKLEDLRDNMDITRFDNFNDVSIDLLKRYHKAYTRLINALEGNY